MALTIHQVLGTRWRKLPGAQHTAAATVQFVTISRLANNQTFSPSLRRLPGRQLRAQKIQGCKEGFVADAQQNRVLGGAVRMRTPAGCDDNVAARPFEAFAIDDGFAM